MLPYPVLTSQLYNACAHSCSNFIKEAGLIISKEHIYLQGRLTIWLLSDPFINHTWSHWQQHLALTQFLSLDSFRNITVSNITDQFFNRIREILEGFQPSACPHVPTDICYVSRAFPAQNWRWGTLSGPCVQTPNGREWLYPGQLEHGPRATDRSKVLPQIHTSALSWKSKLQQP